MPVKMSDKMQVLACKNMYGKFYAAGNKNLELFNCFLLWSLKCRVYLGGWCRSLLSRLIC